MKAQACIAFFASAATVLSEDIIHEGGFASQITAEGRESLCGNNNQVPNFEDGFCYGLEADAKTGVDVTRNPTCTPNVKDTGQKSVTFGFDQLKGPDLYEVRKWLCQEDSRSCKSKESVSIFVLLVSCASSFILGSSLCFILMRVFSPGDAAEEADNNDGEEQLIESLNGQKLVDAAGLDKKGIKRVLDSSRYVGNDSRSAAGKEWNLDGPCKVTADARWDKTHSMTKDETADGEEDTHSAQFEDNEDSLSLPSEDEELIRACEEETLRRFRESIKESTSDETRKKQVAYRDECDGLFCQLKNLLGSKPPDIPTISNLVCEIRSLFVRLNTDFKTASGRITAMSFCCNKVLDLEGLDLLSGAKGLSQGIEENAQAVIETLVPHIWGM